MDIVAIIKEGIQTSDEWCGLWCKPIHLLINAAPIDREEVSWDGTSLSDIRQEANGLIHELVRSNRKAMCTSHSRTSMAAGALYIAGIMKDRRLSQQELGDTFGIHPRTVRVAYMKLVEALNLELL